MARRHLHSIRHLSIALRPVQILRAEEGEGYLSEGVNKDSPAACGLRTPRGLKRCWGYRPGCGQGNRTCDRRDLALPGRAGLA